MLRAYSKEISVTALEPISFNINKINNSNSSINHISGSNSIIIQKPGYYKIDFDISATSAADAAGLVSIQLFANGTAIPDAIITETMTPGTYNSSSFSTIIRANPGVQGQNVALTIVPTVDLTISSTAVGVNKLS